MSNLYRIGVGIMMLNTKNQIFVAERKYPKNAWQMPQGGIELNESPKDAVFREAMEEIGTNNFNIIAESGGWLKYDFPSKYTKQWFEGQYIGQKQKWFLLNFLGTDDEININAVGAEFVNWKWIDVSELEKIIVNFKREMYRKVVSEFKSLILTKLNETF